MGERGYDLRRRVVVIGTLAVGAAVLGVSLRIEQGSPWFYPATVLLAAVWIGGAFLSGDLHLGREGGEPRGQRPVLGPIALGAGLAVVFIVGGLIVREIGPLADQVRGVLGFATEGALPALVAITALNGIAEETFFRGAVMEILTKQKLLWSTVIYTVATLATGNVMLAFAAILLGAIVGRQREVTGGVLAPILTHCTWSLIMLFALPWIFGL